MQEIINKNTMYGIIGVIGLNVLTIMGICWFGYKNKSRIINYLLKNNSIGISQKFVGQEQIKKLLD